MGCKEELDVEVVLPLLWSYFQVVSHLPTTPSFCIKVSLENVDSYLPSWAYIIVFKPAITVYKFNKQTLYSIVQ